MRPPVAGIRGTRYEPSRRSQNARVAKSADAKDLKSFSWQRECGFKSHPGHHINYYVYHVLAECFFTVPKTCPHNGRNAVLPGRAPLGIVLLGDCLGDTKDIGYVP
jgi:hypothetical protein